MSIYYMNKYLKGFMIDFKEKVKEYLISVKQFEEVDEILLRELEFNLWMVEEAKDDIKGRGLLINISQQSNGVEYMNKNLSIGIYNDCLKNINSILIQLGLSLKERQKLKLAISQPDAFDEIMGL